MNLRNAGVYDVGLDIGTASVGWAATDEKGELLHHNGKPTWGSRLSPEADKAADARVHRGQRRRYDRRRQRLDLLQMLFCDEMEKADPEFFVRLNQSRLHPEDREPGHSDYKWPLFNDAAFDEKAYYDAFPTIYHLRRWLMETTEQADIRLIYLALHNIVKHRGNFLQQDNRELSSKNASMEQSVDSLCNELQEWCSQRGIDCSAPEHAAEITGLLEKNEGARSDLQKAIASLLSIEPGEAIERKTANSMATALAKSLIGLKAETAHIFFIDEAPEGLATSVYLSNDEQVEALESTLPDEDKGLFEAMKRVYSSYVLQEILSLVPNGSLSANKVAEYERYRVNLKTLKSLVREYAPDKYDEFFRGPMVQKLYPGEKAKYSSGSKGYTLYNLSHKTSYDDFKKEVQKLFKGTAAESDRRYIAMMEDFEKQTFLRRLKTSDNGAIPFQLHLEEMNEIIEGQKKYYPFLEQQKDKLNSLVTFRIPYYVGPLTQKNARRVNDRPEGELRFAWAERIPGKEGEKIYPWNWEEIIDKNASAEKFIRRMTGMCTYLQGEPVLPKCSLLYEEFCVLNELNGARFTQDGDKSYRFDYQDRADMIEELFKNKKVSYKDVEKWMAQRGNSNVHVSGGQGERGFESKMTSLIFFKKDVFGVDEIPEADYPMIENIILWNTIFEDRDILKQKLQEAYGDRLDAKQIKTICRKRFSGWGNLSEKFLTGLKVNSDNGPVSLMDVLREGDPNNGHGAKAMVLMEALRDDALGFQEAVDAVNAERYGDVSKIALEELPGSPALRRSINQAMRIVEEIARIAGHAPRNIFVEVTRSEDDKRKGQRTRRRYDELKEHLEAFKRDNPDFWDQQLQEELKRAQSSDLGEKLTLYFMQGGKSLYSGKPLDIDRLSEYQVDHILPQSYIKDDSFENKALVLREENQRKSDQMLLPEDVRRSMARYWKALLDAKLIGPKKYNNLTRSEVKEKQLKGFINRQLVETSQIVKTVQMMLESMLPETEVHPVKAGLSSELRRAAHFVKCREINDYHHAHDALLACAIGRFIQTRYPGMYANPMMYQKAIRSHIKEEGARVNRGGNPLQSSFIIASFMKSGFDAETGEVVRDTWNADEELARIARSLDIKQCHITRMPEETSGAFWDATIYSPHDPSKGEKLKLALKKGLDPKKYGGYSREQFAYFFIYEVEAKGKRALRFAPVPVSVATELRSDDGALERYARDLTAESGELFIRIVRERVLKYQLFEHGGSRLYVTGQKEARNGVQIAFDQRETDIAKRIVLEKAGEGCIPVSDEELLILWDQVYGSLNRYSPRLFELLRMDELNACFIDASREERMEGILAICSVAGAKANMVNLTGLQGSKFAGNIKPAYNKLIAEGVDFIDQSITGMFERRTHIGL